MSWIISCSVGLNLLLDHGLLKSNTGDFSPYKVYPLEIRHFIEALPCTLLPEDIALQQLEAQNLDPGRVLVIQHGAERGDQCLVGHGAVPFMLMNFESTLYGGDFYGQQNELEPKFMFIQMFFSLHSESAKRRCVRFPSNAVHVTRVYRYENY